MNENRLPDYLDHMQQAATDACGFVEGLDKDDFLKDKRTQEAATKVMDGGDRGGMPAPPAGRCAGGVAFRPWRRSPRRWPGLPPGCGVQRWERPQPPIPARGAQPGRGPPPGGGAQLPCDDQPCW